MLERMHKTGTEVSGWPQRAKTESEWYGGAGLHMDGWRQCRGSAI